MTVLTEDLLTTLPQPPPAPPPSTCPSTGPAITPVSYLLFASPPTALRSSLTHPPASSSATLPTHPNKLTRALQCQLCQAYTSTSTAGDCTEEELEPPRRSPRVLAREPYPSYPSPAINPYPSLGTNPYPSIRTNPYPSLGSNPYPSIDRRNPYPSLERRDSYSSLERSKEAYSYSRMEPSVGQGRNGEMICRKSHTHL